MIMDEFQESQMMKIDQEEFEGIVKKYYHAVYGVALNKVKDTYIAEDITQEVFTKAYLHLHELREPDKIGYWLFTTATRTCIDWLRKNNRISEEVVESVEDSTGAIFRKNESENQIKEEVWEALNKLPELSKTMIILNFMGGYTQKEIASFLKVSVESVESRIRRAKEKLKEDLIEFIEDELVKYRLDGTSETKMYRICMHIHMNYLRKEKQAEGIGEIRKAVHVNPANPHMKYALALSLFKVYRKTKEESNLQEVEELSKSLESMGVEGLYYAANIYLMKDEYEKAANLFRVISKEFSLNKPITAYQLQLGFALRKQERYDEAEEELQVAAYFYYVRFILALTTLADVSRKKEDIISQQGYLELVSSIINTVGPIMIKSFYNFQGYSDYAKFLMETGKIEEALSAIKQGKDILSKIMNNEISPLFSKSYVRDLPVDERNTIYGEVSSINMYIESLKRTQTLLSSDKWQEVKEKETFSNLKDEINREIEVNTSKLNRVTKKDIINGKVRK